MWWDKLCECAAMHWYYGYAPRWLEWHLLFDLHHKDPTKGLVEKLKSAPCQGGRSWSTAFRGPQKNPTNAFGKHTLAKFHNKCAVFVIFCDKNLVFFHFCDRIDAFCDKTLYFSDFGECCSQAASTFGTLLFIQWE